MAEAPLWRAFEANEVTHSGAHYLLAIAGLVRRTPPRAADVARYLGVSRAAASLQLRSLQEHGLVAVGEHGHLQLTAAGLDLVGRIASKRRILQVFLAEVLGVPEDTAELDACKVEHLLSEESGAALVRWVRFLRSDHPAAVQARAVFTRTLADCPHEGRCDLCADACLLATAAH